MAFNAAAAYQGNKIRTSTPADLTLMLYEGAVKFCNMAIIAFEEENIAKISENIIKTEKIIVEFRVTLDFKYSVANDFDIIYDYLYRRLVEANIKKDKGILEEVLGYLREMRDTWKEVMKKARVN